MAACRSKALPLYSGVLAVLGHRLSGSDAADRNSIEQKCRDARTPGGPEAHAAALVAVEPGPPVPTRGLACLLAGAAGAVGMQLGGTDD